jgi:hypothetical protein
MPSTSAKKAYMAIYDTKPSASNVEALEALFLDVGKSHVGSSGSTSPLLWAVLLLSS